MAVDLLRRGVRLEVVARGGCMRPWLFPGDRLEVAPLTGPPRRGAIVLVECGGALMTHRVIGPREPRTRGDLEPTRDPVSRVLGEVISVSSPARGLAFRVDTRLARTTGLLLAPLTRAVQRAVRLARRLGLR